MIQNQKKQMGIAIENLEKTGRDLGTVEKKLFNFEVERSPKKLSLDEVRLRKESQILKAFSVDSTAINT